MKISVRRIVLLCWLAILLALYGTLSYLCSSAHTDYTTLYSSFRALLEGGNIYAPIPADSLVILGLSRELLSHVTVDTLPPSLNSPFFALLFSPLGLLPYAASFWAWSLLSLAFGITAIVLIRRMEGRTDIDSILILILVLLSYLPVMHTILFGQTSLLVFMLVAGGWAAAREGRDRVGGMLLGMALAMKVFLGLFLFYFLVQRRWGLLSWQAATFAACWLLGLLFLGPDAYLQYSVTLQSLTSYYSSNWNASAYGFVTRIFGGSSSLPLIDFPLLGQTLYFLLSLLLLALLLWLARAKQGDDPLMQFDLGFSYTIVAALLISPLGWMYYFPLLLIPFLTLFRLANSYSLGWNFKGAAIFALLLSSFPQLWNQTPDPRFMFTSAAVYHYALLLLAALLVWASCALRKQALPLAQKRTRAAELLVDNQQLLYIFLGLALVLCSAVAGLHYGWVA